MSPKFNNLFNALKRKSAKSRKKDDKFCKNIKYLEGNTICHSFPDQLMRKIKPRTPNYSKAAAFKQYFSLPFTTSEEFAIKLTINSM